MTNILIMLDDENYYKKIINGLLLRNNNLRVSYITNNLREFIYVISNYKIDVVLMDIKFYKNALKNKAINMKKYKDMIILIGEQKKIDENILKKQCVSGYIYKKEKLSKIIRGINKLINTKFLIDVKKVDVCIEKIIKNKIKKELEYLGYNFLHYGTKYLLETIFILYVLDDYYDDNLIKDIYPIVAEKYGKSVNNIRCNIRNATNIMCYENCEEKIKKYLKIPHIKQAKTKEVIAVILNKIIE